ncbi:hypothetical protein SAZ11_24415 [Streptomyces sp. FXJ1.4098]|nr:hypothetical protein [Streptomyces sp. FXJ1.4098]
MRQPDRPAPVRQGLPRLARHIRVVGRGDGEAEGVVRAVVGEPGVDTGRQQRVVRPPDQDGLRGGQPDVGRADS